MPAVINLARAVAVVWLLVPAAGGYADSDGLRGTARGLGSRMDGPDLSRTRLTASSAARRQPGRQPGSRPDMPSRRSSGGALAGTGTGLSKGLPSPW